MAMQSDTSRHGLIWLNVGLRGIMEIGIVAAYAVWGYGFGDAT